MSYSQKSILAGHYNGMRFVAAEFNDRVYMEGQRGRGVGIHCKSDMYNLLAVRFSILMIQA
jgi:hypothetical protein